MYTDPAAVDEEVSMGGVPSCTDCHQGNASSMDKDEAHKGMPRAFYAAVGPKYKYQSVGREVTGYAPIKPEGKARITYLMSEISDENKKRYGINKLMQLMYPDRDPETFAFSPDAAEKMCGSCHEDELAVYKASGMGFQKSQKGFTSWASHAPGPQNCGAWFGGNYDKIKSETDKPYSDKMNAGLDRGCNKCHGEIVEAVKTSGHSEVDCSSCHIGKSGAYQFTFRGSGMSEGQQNYFSKHKEYYGIMDIPTLVKYPATGLWIPLKPYPMAVMGINKDVKKSGLSLRSIPETGVKGNEATGGPDFTIKRTPDEVNDMFILTGTFKGYGGNDNMMAWIQMDKLSHGIGKSRGCASCHSSHGQKGLSWFTFAAAADVKKPFSGSYIITADKNGMRFTDLTLTGIEPVKGRELTDFAPFVKTLSPWNVKGIDFSIPYSESKVMADETEYMKIYAEINSLKSRFSGDKDKLAMPEAIGAVLAHSRQAGAEKLKDFKAGTK